MRQSESNDGSDRRQSLQMNEGRESGELEGSTLTGSSRDADQGSRAQRRVQNSSGFLLDSSFLPRSKSLRNSYHFPRRSEPDRREKRGVPDNDVVKAKKRSRFPWTRQKDASNESPSQSTEGETIQETPTSHVQQEVRPQELQPTTADQRSSMGLDRDSLQIVNLALNLSESRKTNTLGRSASHRVSSGRWAPTTGPPPAPHTESHPPLAVGGLGHDNLHPRRNFTHSSNEDRTQTIGLWRASSTVNAAPSVLSLLPQSAEANTLPPVFSESTLARAEHARQHFELFTEYLRLLPSLPPLQSTDGNAATESKPVSDDVSTAGRSHNPLQSIRNRKVRFRERCPIDPDGYGWNDIDNVRSWVDSVETKYGRQDHSPSQCLKLPPLPHRPSDVSQKEPNEDEAWAGSPPSSLRRASRTSSIKARRPRLDWIVSPSELLADAAWVEHAPNKSKIIDREGNNLYPDPTMLVDHDANPSVPTFEQPTLPTRDSLDAEGYTSRTSMSDTHPGLATEFKRIGRGRRRHRFRSPSPILSSHSVSKKGSSISRRRKLGKASSSSSSVSSLDAIPSWTARMDDVLRSGRSISPTTGLLKPRGSEASHGERFADRTVIPAQSSAGRAKVEEKSGSISSAPSREDRYGPLPSFATIDSKAPSTPLHMGYFPSIASNLSPPSSRSPSPSKGRLSRTIASRNDQVKHNDPKSKELADESSVGPETLRNNSASKPSDTFLSPGRTESSPLPDRVSPIHHGEHGRPSLHARKGSMQHESKLRGILKGPGKIAEKVSNEVSKMGGLILKKDNTEHSRQSSLATNATTDEGDVSDSMGQAKKSKDSRIEEMKRNNSTRSAIPPQQSFVSSDEGNHFAHRASDNAAAEIPVPSPAAVVSPQGDVEEERKAPEQDVLSKDDIYSQSHDLKESQMTGKSLSTPLINKPNTNVPGGRPEKALSFGPELHTVREQIKKGRIKDPSVPFSMTHPPITGLAQAKVSPASSFQERQPTATNQSRSWSISNRSISTSIDTGIPSKRETERTRALLLSSGIKAREITRRAESVRSPLDFLRHAFGPNSSIPPIPRYHEYELAVQTLGRRVETSHDRFQQSIKNYPGHDSSSLKVRLNELEDMVNNSLNPRVRAAAEDAENLSVQLNTTSTLAVKQLNDTLDKGIRKRHRRLRWIRRAGFGMLEWALVGILWWVWLIVMAFKIIRGVLRGVFSGVRWVLWL
ncbi:uncharacterized protein KD926_005306 [Aspergillus affinis]|uniref:uncharacterized protein n=1 Tax=Aspergillus affinis TaxID=1070780 RepID=UPI0022FDE1FE|nr:uncharacterized protein KD926_005306 [Aspergillus affinis]KAI9042700.1 hypothetical protein KD926_005306 [Aspergillus affinis]